MSSTSARSPNPRPTTASAPRPGRATPFGPLRASKVELTSPVTRTRTCAPASSPVDASTTRIEPVEARGRHQTVAVRASPADGSVIDQRSKTSTPKGVSREEWCARGPLETDRAVGRSRRRRRRSPPTSTCTSSRPARERRSRERRSATTRRTSRTRPAGSGWSGAQPSRWAFGVRGLRAATRTASPSPSGPPAGSPRPRPAARSPSAGGPPSGASGPDASQVPASSEEPEREEE